MKKIVLLSFGLLIAINQEAVSFSGAAKAVKSHIARHKRMYVIGSAITVTIAAVIVANHRGMLDPMKRKIAQLLSAGEKRDVEVQATTSFEKVSKQLQTDGLIATRTSEVQAGVTSVDRAVQNNVETQSIDVQTDQMSPEAASSLEIAAVLARENALCAQAYRFNAETDRAEAWRLRADAQQLQEQARRLVNDLGVSAPVRVWSPQVKCLSNESGASRQVKRDPVEAFSMSIVERPLSPPSIFDHIGYLHGRGNLRRLEISGAVATGASFDQARRKLGGFWTTNPSFGPGPTYIGRMSDLYPR
jgi:hypothetical protein